MSRPMLLNPGTRLAGTTASGETIAAEVYRFDGNTGEVMVTTAWPLRPGALMPNDLTPLVVKDENTTEVAIGVNALRGLFPDGSLRAVGVQFLATLTNDTPKAYTVTVGGPTRTTTDLSWVEPIYSSATATVPAMNHKAVMHPADSQYWCDTFVALVPLKPEADETADAAKTFFRTASGTTQTLGDWADDLSGDPDAGFGVSTYEHCSGWLCAAIRADSSAKRRAYYQRFHDTLVEMCAGNTRYRIGSAVGGNVYARVWGWDASLPAASTTTDAGLFSEAQSGTAMGLASGYLMTGWKQPWYHIAHFASWTWPGLTYAGAKDGLMSTIWLIRYNTSLRMMYRFAAYVVGATMQVGNGITGYGDGRDNDTASWVNDLTWCLDALEEFEYTTANYGAYIDGIVGQRPTADDGGSLGAGEFPTFQIAVVARCLIFYYHNIDDDARIPTWLQTMADFVIAQTTDQSTYYSQPYVHSATPGSEAQEPYYLSFHSELFAWVYAYTANSTYQTWALRAANARELTNPSPFIANVKAMGEYFGGHLQSAKFYIDGGVVRPVSGAHPTSITTRPTYNS